MIYWGIFGFVLLVLFTFCFKCCCESHPPLWPRRSGNNDDIFTL